MVAPGKESPFQRIRDQCVEPVRITHLETDTETAAADTETATDFPLPESLCDAQKQLIQGLVEDVVPISQQHDITPTPEPRNLTQINSQYNNSNTCNVNYTTIYGFATFWNNTVSGVQGLASAVTSFITLPFLASRSTTQASTSPSIAIIKPTMTDAPTPIIYSPEAIIKAVDDLDHWVKQLKDCQATGEKTAEHQLFFRDFDVSTNTSGGMRDGWFIAMEDILTLEKELRNTFGPLDRDVAKLGRDLGAHPAAKRWIREAEASTWGKFLGSMPWSFQHSPIQVVFTNYERIRMLSVKNRIKGLRGASCELRDSIEMNGGKLSPKADKDLRGGISAIASRGNLLCDLFLQADQRVQRLGRLLHKSTDDQKTAQNLGETMMNLAKLKTVSRADVKMVELKLQQWVGKMTGPVKKLHFVDLDK
ncbi:hypothetical protein B0J15DRAFT_556244 [Fusarium solani]|uniref:Uncharacterized protein n=1 Tax=Fusarium solani TaxID=169388 RepID=A0A9P9FZV3_FUSSL|nr:uncharacterized protein B0J15DRAFT_556244 [Fusarium solani]KAH7228628.1 hypothetical protein B0J15DRAFT_556244 [Fusarium solani]